MKAVRWIGIILGCLVFAVVLSFAAFYLRYQSQSPAIHDAVNGFLAGIVAGDVESLKPYIDERFTDQMRELLKQHHVDFFAHIASHSENKAYFSYHLEVGTGETTDYEGIVVFDDTGTSSVSIKLIKNPAGWQVYGFKIGSGE
ncbi:hypothetical protein EBR66_05390 [bacterium]|nr:hypothetical protein [bacterium]